MTTLEDKILGEKLENYCSSSEDEAEYEDADDEPSSSKPASEPSASTYAENWSGTSANTGPKGVIKDWQRFKQLESEKNEEKERERLMLMKKLAITTKTKAEDEKQKEDDEFDAEFDELLNSDAMLAFQRERMMEMLKVNGQLKTFGQVISLRNGDEFLNAIDMENKNTTVIVHIYENNLAACEMMDKCLHTLAKEYVYVKFCRIASSVAGMSKHFKISGIPALLVYKAKNLIGNFVRVSDELGGDVFFPSDVESFLIENAMLPDKTHVPALVNNVNDDSDDE
ncbi:phosducin-like protein [Bradysia coprophila]|uniref:phosducin-like protein n=1 Tax=Bradysia coprophila TaxID=38358 RepID=UPI00187D8A5E|nr:phosducin-like protein [Bradysia coprophila]